MSDDIRRMDVNEFRELGFLQEVNRLFMHPRGLALEIVIEADGSARIGGVWDYREDPEGVAFFDPPEAHKADIVEAEYQRHAATRIDLFGDPVQPVGVGLPR